MWVNLRRIHAIKYLDTPDPNQFICFCTHQVECAPYTHALRSFQIGNHAENCKIITFVREENIEAKTSFVTSANSYTHHSDVKIIILFLFNNEVVEETEKIFRFENIILILSMPKDRSQFKNYLKFYFLYW